MAETYVRHNWLNSACRDRRLSPSEFRVAYFLAECRNGDSGACYPAQATISAATGLSIRSVSNCTNKLAEVGYIVVRKHGWGKSSDYVLVMPERDVSVAEGTTPTFTDRQNPAGQQPARKSIDRQNPAGQQKGTSGTDRQNLAGQQSPKDTNDLQDPAGPDLQDPAAKPLKVTSEESKREGESPITPSDEKDDTEERLIASFTSIYPKNSRSSETRRELINARSRATDHEILEGAQAYARKVQGREARYISDPPNWLRGNRWLEASEPEILVDPLAGFASQAQNGRRPAPIDFVALAASRVAARQTEEELG